MNPLKWSDVEHNNQIWQQKVELEQDQVYCFGVRHNRFVLVKTTDPLLTRIWSVVQRLFRIIRTDDELIEGLQQKTREMIPSIMRSLYREVHVSARPPEQPDLTADFSTGLAPQAEKALELLQKLAPIIEPVVGTSPIQNFYDEIHRLNRLIVEQLSALQAVNRRLQENLAAERTNHNDAKATNESLQAAHKQQREANITLHEARMKDRELYQEELNELVETLLIIQDHISAILDQGLQITGMQVTAETRLDITATLNQIITFISEVVPEPTTESRPPSRNSQSSIILNPSAMTPSTSNRSSPASHLESSAKPPIIGVSSLSSLDLRTTGSAVSPGANGGPAISPRLLALLTAIGGATPPRSARGFHPIKPAENSNATSSPLVRPSSVSSVYR